MGHNDHDLVQKPNSPWFGQGMGHWRTMVFIQGARVGQEHSQGPGLRNLPQDCRPFLWQKAELHR